MRVMFSTSLLPLGGLRGPYYVEDVLVRVPVPSWVDPSGWSALPSSSLVHSLGISRSKNSPVRLCEVVVAFLSRLFPKPVAWKRWKFVRPEVRERAIGQWRDERELMAEAVAAALCIVEPTSSPERSFEADLRQQLNEAVTGDFLGPDWRDKEKCSGDAGSLRCNVRAASTTPEDDLLLALAKEERERFLDELTLVLSKGERKLLTAIRDGVPPRDWAKGEGLSDSTVDTMMYRIRGKARKVLSRMGFHAL